MGWRWGLNAYGHGWSGGGDGRVFKDMDGGGVVVGIDGGGGVVMVMECLGHVCGWRLVESGWGGIRVVNGE